MSLILTDLPLFHLLKPLIIFFLCCCWLFFGLLLRNEDIVRKSSSSGSGSVVLCLAIEFAKNLVFRNYLIVVRTPWNKISEPTSATQSCNSNVSLIILPHNIYVLRIIMFLWGLTYWAIIHVFLISNVPKFFAHTVFFYTSNEINQRWNGQNFTQTSDTFF